MTLSTTNTAAWQAEAFAPSTFGSRRDDRAARGHDRAARERRLVSLGVVTVPLELAGRAGGVRLVQMEHLYDADHPSRRYRRLVPHGSLEPLHDVSGKEDSVESLGRLDRGTRPAGTFPPAVSDPPPEPIA